MAAAGCGEPDLGAVPERGARPGQREARRPSCGHIACQAKCPRQTIDPDRGARPARSSAASQGAQVSRSATDGLFAGGAQRTAAAIRAAISRWPSPAATLVGWAARPQRHSEANRTSPLRSPVKIRPVRFPPWAAGARPMISTAGWLGAPAGNRPSPVRARPRTSGVCPRPPAHASRPGAGRHGRPTAWPPARQAFPPSPPSARTRPRVPATGVDGVAGSSGQPVPGGTGLARSRGRAQPARPSARDQAMPSRMSCSLATTSAKPSRVMIRSSTSAPAPITSTRPRMHDADLRRARPGLAEPAAGSPPCTGRGRNPGVVDPAGIVGGQAERDRGHGGDRAGQADQGARAPTAILGRHRGDRRVDVRRSPPRSPPAVGGSQRRCRSVIRTQPMSTETAAPPREPGPARPALAAEHELGRTAADVDHQVGRRQRPRRRPPVRAGSASSAVAPRRTGRLLVPAQHLGRHPENPGTPAHELGGVRRVPGGAGRHHPDRAGAPAPPRIRA